MGLHYSVNMGPHVQDLKVRSSLFEGPAKKDPMYAIDQEPSCLWFRTQLVHLNVVGNNLTGKR